MEIHFKKMHGTMNDFVMFHDLHSSVKLTTSQVQFLCNRRSGIGGDGVIVVRESQHADFFMDYINSDGSLAEMCGNGIRCLGKYVFDNELTSATRINVETRAGIKTLDLFPDDDGKISSVRVEMGKPIFDAKLIPTTIVAEAPIVDFPVLVKEREFAGTLVSMGNPHIVIFSDEDVSNLPVTFGPDIESHDFFPAKINVEFVRISGPNALQMRVWERGSGETYSCGTGACASVVAAILKNKVTERAEVNLLGGNLDISWAGKDSPVLMTGPATTVFSGEVSL